VEDGPPEEIFDCFERNKACHGHWQRQYQSKTPSTIIPRKRTLLEAFLHKDPSEQAEDEWERWVSAPAIPQAAQSGNLFRWHVDNQESFPALHQMALDTLSIPAMSTECERVFSSSKKLLVRSVAASRRTL
jgi:hypothetical protein